MIRRDIFSGAQKSEISLDEKLHKHLQLSLIYREWIIRGNLFSENHKPEVFQGAMLHGHLQLQAFYLAWIEDWNHHHAHSHFAKDLHPPYSCQCSAQLNPHNPGGKRRMKEHRIENMKETNMF